jgi:hypothetical protein
MRKPTEQERYEFVARTVDVAIIQGAECSKFRNWLIERGLSYAKGGIERSGNAEEIMLGFYESLIDAFNSLVDPEFDEEKHLARVAKIHRHLKIQKGQIPSYLLSTIDYGVPGVPWANDKQEKHKTRKDEVAHI